MSFWYGEAVAIGIALMYALSVGVVCCRKGTDLRVRALLERLGFELWHPACEASQRGWTLTADRKESKSSAPISGAS